MGIQIACMIPTIGRHTLTDAINSAVHQFDQVLVIADANDLPGHLPTHPHITYLRTGHPSPYGVTARNLAAYTTSCDWIAQLDDDDTWTPDARHIIQTAIQTQPDIDIWIPGLQYNDGLTVCLTPDQLTIGNVAQAITTPTTWAHVPMTTRHPDPCDYHHIADMTSHGHTIGWLQHAIYNVRPNLEGHRGYGQP